MRCYRTRALLRSLLRTGRLLVAVLAGVLCTAPAAGAVTNVVGNPGFETGTSGWNTSGGASGVTLAQVSGGHSGASAVRLTNATSANGECTLNDSPNWVAKTQAGSYMGSLWARADTPGATLTLRFREYTTSGTRLGVGTSRITLDTAWRHVTVTLPVSAPGGSTFDFNAYVSNAAPGTCFYADDAAVVNVAPDSPPSAALTVGPGSGGGALDVTADALSSTAGKGIAGYTFDFGDGSPATGPQAAATAAHTYDAPGTYAVAVRVTNAAGNVSTATQQVTVPYAAPSPAPTAVVTLTPSSGSSPLTVTVDASGSTPGASPIAAYSLDYGDGPFESHGVSTPSSVFDVTYTESGIFNAKLTVADTAGRQTSTYAPVTVASGFETGNSVGSGTFGWNTSGGASGIALNQVAGGHVSGSAAELINTNATNATCLLNDSPNLVSKTAAGQYTGSIWVRADTPGAPLTLRLREYGPSGSLLRTQVAISPLTTSWQHLNVTMPVTAPGSTLDYNAYVSKAAPGSCFYADDAGVSSG